MEINIYLNVDYYILIKLIISFIKWVNCYCHCRLSLTKTRW